VCVCEREREREKERECVEGRLCADDERFSVSSTKRFGQSGLFINLVSWHQTSFYFAIITNFSCLFFFFYLESKRSDMKKEIEIGWCLSVLISNMFLSNWIQFSMDAFNWLKVTLQIFFICIKCCSFQLYKNVFENKKYWFKKKCFQLLENGFQKCFFETKSAYKNDFWRIV